MQELAGIALVGAAMFVMIAGRHVASNALGWALLTGVFIASYTVIDAHGVRAAPTPASYIVWVFVPMGGGVVAMFGIASRGAHFASAARQWKHCVMAGARWIFTYGLALWAVTLGPKVGRASGRE